jgi:hypothetical protein
VANYNVDIDVAVRGFNRVEQNLKKLDQLVGKPRVIDINPGIQFRKFRRDKQQLLLEMRRAGAESAVAYQEAFERAMARDRRIASMTAGAGSRTLPGTTGPFGLLPATAVGQFQRAANAARTIDTAFANAKRSIDDMTANLTKALPGGISGSGVRIAGLLPAAGGTGGTGGGGGGGFGSFTAPGIPDPRGGFNAGINPNMYASPIGPMAAPGFTVPSTMQGVGQRFGGAVAAGAFPLLFGGGIGQATGGFLGGLGSGKMFSGLTVGLQVLGGTLDKLAADTQAVALASREAGTALQLMTERNLFSTKEIQRRAEELAKLGKAEELASLLTSELVEKLGSEGFDALQDLGDETDRVNKLWSELTIQLQALIAGPLSDFLSLIGDLLQEQVQFNRLNALRKDLAGTAAGEQLEQRIGAIRGQGAKLELLGGQKMIDPFADTRTSTALTGDIADELFEEFKGNRKKPTRKMGLDLSGVTRPGKTDAERLAEKVAAAERSAKAVQREADSLEIITGLRDRMAAAELIGDKQTANRLRTSIEIAQIEERRDDALAKINAKELPEEIKQKQRIALKSLFLSQVEEARADGARRYAEIIRDEQNEALKDQADILKRNFDLQEEEFKKAQELAKGLTDIVRDGFVDGIKAATDETRSLSEALTNMLNRLSDQLLQMAANLAFYGNAQGTLSQGQGIVGTLLGSVASIFNPFSGLTGPGDRYGGMSPEKFIKMGGPTAPPPVRALGGPVGAGQPYLVGERGPELFIPGAQGNIVPNNAMGSTSVIVNVDASGTEVQGNQGGADQLGRLIGSAVQAELIKQKRPGGLLTR